jgi:hydrogenase maturation protease
VTEFNAKIAVVGIGNPYVSDDGVGCRVVRELKRRVRDSRVTFIELVTCGLDAFEHLRGFEKAVIIDAAKTGSVRVGFVQSVSPCSASATSQFLSLHTIGLELALGLGSILGLALPHTLDLLSVEVADIETFHEGCTPEVEAALPAIVDSTVDFLKSYLPDLHCSQDSMNVIAAP